MTPTIILFFIAEVVIIIHLGSRSKTKGVESL